MTIVAIAHPIEWVTILEVEKPTGSVISFPSGATLPQQSLQQLVRQLQLRPVRLLQKLLNHCP
jgi:hypothetical protein